MDFEEYVHFIFEQTLMVSLWNFLIWYPPDGDANRMSRVTNGVFRTIGYLNTVKYANAHWNIGYIT